MKYVANFQTVIHTIRLMTNEAQRRALNGIDTYKDVTIVPLSDDIDMVITNFSGNGMYCDPYEHAEMLDVHFIYRHNGKTVTYHGNVYDIKHIHLHDLVKVMRRVQATPCNITLGVMQYINDFADEVTQGEVM